MFRLSNCRVPAQNAVILAAAVVTVLSTAPAFAGGNRSDVPPPPGKGSGVHVPSGSCTIPANDNCANATVISTSPFTTTEDTSCATDEIPEPQSTCTTQGLSVWFSWTNSGPNQAIVTADTFGSDFDTAMMVWDGTCASSVVVACNDDDSSGGDGFQSKVSFVAQPGHAYLIQAGGFDGDFGSLTFNFSVQILLCPSITVDGTLGSGSPSRPFTTGNQTGRLNRNGVSSSCAVAKTCNVFTATGLRQFDAYTFANASGVDQCVLMQLDVTTPTGCNLQANAYLDTYDPANICTNYLADPGLSSGGGPQTPVNMSFTVPAGHAAVIPVHTTNPGETACAYTLTILGDLCAPTADLSITKTDGVTSATPGGSVTYTIVASNLTGPFPVTGGTVADTFPASLTCTWTCAGANLGTCTAAGAGNINDSVNLPVGASVTYTASCTVSASATGTLSNTATVSSPITDPTAINDTATDTDTLLAAASVAVTGTKTVSGTFNPGGTVTYTIVLSNAGTGAQNDNPGDEFVDTLPPLLSLVSASATSGTASTGGNTVHWNGSIPASGSVTITITATILFTAGGQTISNQGTISFDADVNGTNESSGVTDDPGVGGGTDATQFGVLGAAAAGATVPVLNVFGLLALAGALAAVAVWRLVGAGPKA